MQDVDSAYARLGSPLLGALIHAVTVAAPLVDSAVAAAKVYGEPSPGQAFFVDARRLVLSAEPLRALELWPQTEGSLFALAPAWSWTDACFRPRQVMEANETPPASLYEPLATFVRVIDCLCATFRLANGNWGLITFLRCNDQPIFSDKDFAAIERLKPELARVTLEGLQREIAGPDAPADALLSDPRRLTRRSPAENIKILSKTEQQILPYLRSSVTEREIAQAIHRSPHTVHVHVKNIYRKLGIGSRRELQALFGV